MSTASGRFWQCPKCHRHVPDRQDGCRCGYGRTADADRPSTAHGTRTAAPDAARQRTGFRSIVAGQAVVLVLGIAVGLARFRRTPEAPGPATSNSPAAHEVVPPTEEAASRRALEAENAALREQLARLPSELETRAKLGGRELVPHSEGVPATPARPVPTPTSPQGSSSAQDSATSAGESEGVATLNARAAAFRASILPLTRAFTEADSQAEQLCSQYKDSCSGSVRPEGDFSSLGVPLADTPACLQLEQAVRDRRRRRNELASRLPDLVDQCRHAGLGGFECETIFEQQGVGAHMSNSTKKDDDARWCGVRQGSPTQ